MPGRYFGAPGPRTVEHRQVTAGGELWLPVKTALIGILVTDAMLMVPILGSLAVGSAWLPVAMTGAAIIAVGFGTPRLFPPGRDGETALDKSQILAMFVSLVSLILISGSLWLGIVFAEAVWTWIGVGIQAFGSMIWQFLSPMRWYVMIAIGILYIYLRVKLEVPAGAVIPLIGIFYAAWTSAWYTLFPPIATSARIFSWLPEDTWVNYFPLIWSRAKYIFLVWLFPIIPWGTLLIIRLIPETVAGNVLPVQIMPIDIEQLARSGWIRGTLGALFPGIITPEGGLPEPEPFDEDPGISRLLVTDGKKSQLAGLPRPKKDPDGHLKYAVDLLSGKATIQEGDRNHVGATDYGYTQAQYRGEDTDEQGRPVEGLKAVLERLNVWETGHGRQKPLSEIGKRFFVQLLMINGWEDRIPPGYEDLVQEFEERQTVLNGGSLPEDDYLRERMEQVYGETYAENKSADLGDEK